MVVVHICHITSAHDRYDTRIFRKESKSMAKFGHKVSLVVADGQRNELRDGVNIEGVPKEKKRFNRMLKSAYRVYKTALSLEADIYHIHDPELLPYALCLSINNRKVIFDAHEDFPKQLKGKYYLNKYVGISLSVFFNWFETFVCRRISGVIGATPSITDKFKLINPRSENINNYPLEKELSPGVLDWSQKKAWVAYVGGITSQRGIEEVVSAMSQVPEGIKLQLAGKFGRGKTRNACEVMDGWKNVSFLDFLERDSVKAVLEGAIAGLVTFHPLPNHVDSQPNKMFEYMSAGVPVIGSNFELWRNVIEGNQCGICVDPLDPDQIAEAIKFLYENPKEANEMGRRGQMAVKEKYNWTQEEKKLLSFYERINEQA